MKRFFLPLAALAITLASCDVSTNDSYSIISFAECNLVSDLQDDTKPAQISSGVYSLKLYTVKNFVNLSTSSLIINNQTLSFDTDTIPLKQYYLVSQESNTAIPIGTFSSRANVASSGATVTNLDALYTPANYAVNDLYVPEVTSPSHGYRLVMGYDLNDRYHVQTFWADCFYMGQSFVSGTSSFNTSKTSYRVQLDPSKNTARVIVYHPEFSESDQDVPKAIVFEEVPVKFTNRSYYLESDAPKTRVLGSTKSSDGKTEVAALVDSDKYNASNFSLTITEKDLTEVSITYTIDGKRITFHGASIVKAKN